MFFVLEKDKDIFIVPEPLRTAKPVSIRGERERESECVCVSVSMVVCLCQRERERNKDIVIVPDPLRQPV